MAKDGENKKLKEKIRGYSNAMNAMEYEAALDSYYTNKRNDETVVALKDKSARDQWAENEKIRQLKVLSTTDQYDKNQQIYETTIDAIDLAARDAEERVRLGLDEQIAEFAFQYDDLERDMFKEAAQAGLQYDQKQQSLESARITDMVTQEQIKLERKYKQKDYEEQLKQNTLQKRSTRLDKRNINNEKLKLRNNKKSIKLDRKKNFIDRQSTKEQRKQNRLEKKRTTGDLRKQMFDQTLENIQATGAARAKGQIGQSTKRAVTTANALNGINQKQLEDNLYFSQKTLDSQRNQINNQLKNQRLDYKKQGLQLKNNKLDKKGLNIQLKQNNIQKETIKSQRKTIKASRRKELGNSKGRLKVKGFEKMSLKQAARTGGTLGLQMSQSRSSKKLTRTEVRREQNYISEQLGITQEEFEMSREKLAESLASAAAQSELKLKNIKTKEFEAQGQAYAAKMVRPRFGDAAPTPYKTPTTQFVLPKPAPKTPMMQGSMGRGANRPASGGSIALGIGSTALAIGAGFATGGTATALMGASGVLGGLSSLFS